MSRILLSFTKLLFIIALPIFLISTSLAWGFNSLWLYEYGFHKYHVQEATKLQESDLTMIGESLIRYFNSSEEYIHVYVNLNGKTTEVFTLEEQIHFKDVKKLVRLDYLIMVISFSLILAISLLFIFIKKGQYRSDLARIAITGSSLSLFLLVFLTIASIINFDQLFLQFHYLAFTNQYWSAQGYMLLLFPGGFWYDAALICMAFIAFLAILILILSIFYLRYSRYRQRTIRQFVAIGRIQRS
ncbi:MAG: TIGR01906 family membrane protein [Dehalococcoidales bacterium]|jgi:integral membrane protein (TIGR01906 family)|nr:TIGR01906 family membrane protein [Dehalococcoidales bacterium]